MKRAAEIMTRRGIRVSLCLPEPDKGEALEQCGIECFDFSDGERFLLMLEPDEARVIARAVRGWAAQYSHYTPDMMEVKPDA